MKAQFDELTVEVASLKQQLDSAEIAAVHNYIAHFHETADYDCLDLY